MVQGMPIPLLRLGIIGAVLLLAACSLKAGRGTETPGAEGVAMEQKKPAHGAEYEIEDLRRIPQELGRLAAAGPRLDQDPECRKALLEEFRRHYFAPWNDATPGEDAAELRRFMKLQARATWYGPNRRKVPPRELQEILENCALEEFPSRSQPAIAVAPAHLRGIPSYQPLYKSPEDYPFDMISYPQVKLNEPLRVRHASRDGVWLFVETGYSSGWLERRDVALVDRELIEEWLRGPLLAVLQDYLPVPDGKGVGVFRAKLGTILLLRAAEPEEWQVAVASAGEGGKAEIRVAPLPRAAAAPFPAPFAPETVALVGDQMLGDAYGWGEIYDLRDCSALLRDFFLPFGIWLPRTSADQIASLPERIDLTHLNRAEREELIRGRAVPFLTLLYKPGHIMLYVGLDQAGRPLVFHDAWSISLKDVDAGTRGEDGKPAGRTQIIGMAAITTLEPGKELGLVPGGSLLEKVTEFGTITARCRQGAQPTPQHR